MHKKNEKAEKIIKLEKGKKYRPKILLTQPINKNYAEQP